MILLTGGAGYIGSHTLHALRQRGDQVLVLDDMSEGHSQALQGATLLQGSTLDASFLRSVFAQHPIKAVCHFAARCYVGESVTDPGLYYQNNVVGTLNLLRAMAEGQVKQIVFSSTCATYGEPESMPIVESTPQNPVNPYGQTKLICEKMLRDFHGAHGIASVSLRYFNAAGAQPGGEIGEDHAPETHLIPLVLQVALGQRKELTVFGTDYPTADGSCVRDYVHVCDLAAAHILALDALKQGLNAVMAYNLGNDKGTSVLSIIEEASRITGQQIAYKVGARRPGDPPILVGSPELIQRELGWQPHYSTVDSILSTAWEWHRHHPRGYAQ